MRGVVSSETAREINRDLAEVETLLGSPVMERFRNDDEATACCGDRNVHGTCWNEGV